MSVYRSPSPSRRLQAEYDPERIRRKEPVKTRPQTENYINGKIESMLRNTVDKLRGRDIIQNS